MGGIPVFKAEDVSQVDIDELIDIGLRFDIKSECEEGCDFGNLEEYLRGAVNEGRFGLCKRDL